MLKIEFHVSKPAAVLAGRDHFGPTTVVVAPSQLTEQQRQTAVEIMQTARYHSTPGDRSCDLALPYFSGDKSDSTGRFWIEATVETVREALDDAREVRERQAARERQEKEAAARREQGERDQLEAKIQGVLARGPEALIDTAFSSGLWSMRYKGFLPHNVATDPRVVELQRQAEALVKEHNGPVMEEIRRETAAAQAAEAEAAQRLADQKALWLEVHGTDRQKAMAKRGLLRDADLVDAMRDFYLAPLDVFPKFQKIVASELDGYGKALYRSSRAETATAEEFGTLEAIEEAAKGIDGEVTCSLWRHAAWLDDEGESVNRSSIKVEAKIGELTFSRRYACPTTTTSD
jgi:hypothetical protein